MNVAKAPPKMQVPDIAAQVTYAMRQMGVSPIPRNYELFYEAYIGSNPKLTKELAALGARATQEELDAIGAQYFGHHQASGLDGAHSRMVGELDGLLSMLKQEQNSLESYNKLLTETYTRINTKSVASADLLRNAITILSDATGDTMAKGAKTVEGVQAKSREMENQSLPYFVSTPRRFNRSTPTACWCRIDPRLKRECRARTWVCGDLASLLNGWT